MSITAETRREAYEESRVTSPKRWKLIYNCLLQNGGMTAAEIADKLGYKDMNSVRPRLTELKEAGLVEVTGRRPSPRTGRSTAVWEVVEDKKSRPGAGTSEGSKGKTTVLSIGERKKKVNGYCRPPRHCKRLADRISLREY